jgi:hypothetical protein
MYIGIYYCLKLFVKILNKGNWDNDKMHGEGLLIFLFGGYFYGNFYMNNIEGVGVLVYPYSKLILGYWK